MNLSVKKHMTHEIVFEENYSSVIIFEITLAQNFIFNVSQFALVEK